MEGAHITAALHWAVLPVNAIHCFSFNGKKVKLIKMLLLLLCLCRSLSRKTLCTSCSHFFSSSRSSEVFLGQLAAGLNCFRLKTIPIGAFQDE